MRSGVRRGALALGALVLLAVIVAGVWVSLPLPPTLLARDRESGTQVVDRSGLTLYSSRARDGSRVSWAGLDEIDPDLINAFIAVEDKRFWDHPGVDVLAIGRACRDNLHALRIVSGASTITMQLARLAQPGGRTWDDKFRQMLWALRIERHLTKQRILEEYLNRVHLGQATVGVGAAAALYFGARPSELSIGQAATLAGLAHAPARDNPHANPRRALARRQIALARMLRAGTATRADVQRARAEPLALAGGRGDLLAPHFTTRVLSWIDREPATGSVRTSLDLPLQAAVEGEVRHTTQVLHYLGVKQAAVVVLDNRSGEVLAWVGSPDFWAPDAGQTDMVVSARQPGSALKPFLYGLALDRGYTASSVLPDIPRTFATATGPYEPRNYDRRFRGPVRVREALASSYNVPAVELAAHLGTATFLHTLQVAGFQSLDHDAEYYGLGLALGNGDVTLIELANGYRALASGGEWRPWTWRAAPAGAPQGRSEPRRVISVAASAILLDILQDPVARIPGFGTSTPFDFPFPVAVKTGTSRHFTDNWAIGTTGNFTVAVWAGNFSGRPMAGVSGVTGAGPLLHRVVMLTAERFPPGALLTPAQVGAKSIPVCRLSGLAATADCAQYDEWFLPGTEPRPDDWERGGRLVLPREYAQWARPEIAIAATAAATPAGADSSRPSPARELQIVSPLDGDRYSIPPGVAARYATIGLRAVGVSRGEVRWSVDGHALASSRWQLSPGAHVIRARTTWSSAEVRIVVE